MGGVGVVLRPQAAGLLRRAAGNAQPRSECAHGGNRCLHAAGCSRLAPNGCWLLQGVRWTSDEGERGLGRLREVSGPGVQRSAQGAREVIGSVQGAHKESGKRPGRPRRCASRAPNTRGANARCIPSHMAHGCHNGACEAIAKLFARLQGARSQGRRCRDSARPSGADFSVCACLPEARTSGPSLHSPPETQGQYAAAQLHARPPCSRRPRASS